MKDDQLDEEEFEQRKEDGVIIGRYDAQEILADKKLVEEKTIRAEQNFRIKFLTQGLDAEKITKERMKIGEYYEAFFYQNGGGEDGIFPEAMIYKTSKTDDWNGIDFIVETSKDHLGIATDVTMVADVNDLVNKLDRSKSDIDRGVFAEIKYFDFEDKNKKLKVPRAVVAAEYESVVRTLKLWAHNEQDRNLITGMKIKALLEIEAQFDAELEYARAINKRAHVLVLEAVLKKTREDLNLHAHEINKYLGKIEEDVSYQTILSWARSLKTLSEKKKLERDNE